MKNNIKRIKIGVSNGKKTQKQIHNKKRRRNHEYFLLNSTRTGERRKRENQISDTTMKEKCNENYEEVIKLTVFIIMLTVLMFTFKHMIVIIHVVACGRLTVTFKWEHRQSEADT